MAIGPSNLKQADDIIVNIAQKTAKQRLAETLLNLNNKFSSTKNDFINVQLSREDFADIIGVATESAIRLLSEFKKKEIIEFKGKNIAIIDKNGLEKIAQGF